MAIDRAFYSLIKRLPGRAVSILSIYDTTCFFTKRLCISIQQLLVCNRNQVSVSGIAIKVQFGYCIGAELIFFQNWNFFFNFLFQFPLEIWFDISYGIGQNYPSIWFSVWGHSKTKWSNFVLFWPPTLPIMDFRGHLVHHLPLVHVDI